MWYRIAADLVLVVHLLFIVFVIAGAFLAWRWPRLIWVAVPAMTKTMNSRWTTSTRSAPIRYHSLLTANAARQP